MVPACVFTLLSLLSFAPAPAQDQCIGWATVGGAVTGGAGGEVVTVSTPAELTSNIAKEGKRVIRVQGKIAVQRISMSEVKDLTIEGAGRGAELEATFYIESAANVIIRNLIISAVNGGQMDIFSMEEGANHIWIDHCDISDKRNKLDGLVDMTHGCDNITISWNKFHYPDNTLDHRFAMLISHSDDAGGEDAGKERITIHHNWWADNITERMPRARFGKIHIFNNYYSAAGNNYCIGPGVDAEVVVESNYFENVNNPHIFFDSVSSAQIRIDDDNQYVNVTGRRDVGQGSVFAIPYSYRLDVGADVKRIVMAGAGPFGTPVSAERRNKFFIGSAPQYAPAFLRPGDFFTLHGAKRGGREKLAAIPMVIPAKKPVVQLRVNK
ncbi:MAG: hypothetical protein JXA18_03275 [Chitinispirillaceae bacterium]|nr:hypothetical protein [Chitinispirillaceae bacterium]